MMGFYFVAAIAYVFWLSLNCGLAYLVYKYAKHFTGLSHYKLLIITASVLIVFYTLWFSLVGVT